MDLYLIQGWSTPFFGAKFTARSGAVKQQNRESTLKGWRKVGPLQSADGRFRLQAITPCFEM
ncbi:hypothetical protein EQV97_06590 [Pseudomonas sp. TMW22090]|jgi:hypothetical protein|nr:hypothetical protein [Pseudomonas sp. TMW22090]